MNTTLAALLGAVLIIGACTSATSPEAALPSPSTTNGPSVVERADKGFPSKVAEVRAAILLAAESGDYDMLRPLLDPEVFLSDFGFGPDEPDPVSRWEAMGSQPLQMMSILLEMQHVVENTNEGVLYRWPTYDEETRSLSQLRDEDKRAFRSTIRSQDVRQLVPNAEYGYVGPRLGILADGTWWFFILEPGP